VDGPAVFWGRLVVEILVGGEGLAELPPRRHDVLEDDRLAAGGGEREAEPLAGERGEALPVGAPVPGHLDPIRGGALHRHALDGAAPGHVGHQHQLEVVEAGDGEPHAAVPPALDPARIQRNSKDQLLVSSLHWVYRSIELDLLIVLPLVEDGDDAGAVDADVLPGGLGHVEVGARRAAPAAAGERPVGRAEVGGGDGDPLARPAPPGLAGVADDHVALPARRAVVEQRRAQRGVVDAVSLVVQVAVPARSACVHTVHTRHTVSVCTPCRAQVQTIL
jgi:hypothetical protein